MTRLSVNINKIATLRNARGGKFPDVLRAAINCQDYGAQGITVHPRPDERHIRYQDVIDIKPFITTEFNIEGYPTRKFLDLVLSILPDQVTLVPDLPDVITSNAGWDTIKHKIFLKEVISEIKRKGIRVYIFVDTIHKHIDHAKDTGTDRIELYTEPYAAQYHMNRDKAIKPYIEAANLALKSGLELNAGHDLNLDNLRFLYKNLPGLKEVSIGHALISDALYYGLENTIQMYLRELRI